MRILTGDLSEHIDKSVTIEGWLHKKRKLGGLNFLLIRDRSGVAQVLVKSEEEMEKLRGLQIGTVLRVVGTVESDERAPGGVEVHDPSLEVLVAVEDEPPIEIDKPLSHESDNLDTLFEHRVIGLRNLQETLIFKVQAEVLKAARAYFNDHGFTEMNTPKLLAEATEGGAEVFKLDYFGKEATLAQSAQFYKQIMVGVFERVFETNPTYRAELSNTTRHMSEYITIDAEMGFIEFDDLLTFTGGLIKHVADQIWSIYGDELLAMKAVKPVFSEAIPRLPMEEVHKLYSEAHPDEKNTEGADDLIPAEERWICEYASKKLGSEAVFVTEWPVTSMKFYHRVNSDNPELADRSDLLFRGIEIATVPMREHRYEKLVEQIKAGGHDPEHPGYRYYLQAFKYGLPPHGGFGLGLERLTQEIMGLKNVKEATLFPRDVNRLTP